MTAPRLDADPTPPHGIALSANDRAFIDAIERFTHRPPVRAGDIRRDVVIARLRELAIDLDLGDDRRARYVWAAYIALGGER